MTFDVNKHSFVPKHTKLGESEKAKVLEKFSIAAHSLPKVLSSDPAVLKLGGKGGDVIKIERESKTAGIVSYYRVVVEV
jgi:DNA-directed RNA polymerase subunit H